MSVPQIRIAAIEAIARKILMEYDPSLLEGEPCAIPIETIIETKFDLILEYHILRKNGSILGETIFDDGAVILYDQYQHEYRLIGVKAGTILINERLCEPQSLGRLRFTCGHELAHWVLHKKLYTGTGDVAAYDGNSSTDESNGIIERQADAMATQILSICIFLVIYGRMIEVYLVTSIGPIPLPRWSTGMGLHRAELPSLPAGPGISSLPHYDLRGHLRGAGGGHLHIRR